MSESIKNASLCMSLLFIIIFSADLFSEEKISPEKSKEIIDKLRAVETQYYKKYRGIEYLRTEIIKEYDPSGDKLLSTSTLLVSRKEYFYEEPEYKVMKYVKDGKEMKPAEYKKSKSLPLYPVFDENGKYRYDSLIEGYETIDGKKCYRIKISPKEATKRHFMGYCYYDVKNLKAIKSDSTLGKLTFGSKEFSFKALLKTKDDYSFVQEFIQVMRIKIPLVVDRRMIITGKTINAMPIIR